VLVEEIISINNYINEPERGYNTLWLTAVTRIMGTLKVQIKATSEYLKTKNENNRRH
jgi:transcription initiation factor IIE alpha subunit